ncbi:MAG: GIY-YIG nuclease family protein [Candidatus Roizmanbacteria bacterium]|nr:MAG: GIY-YIG nuclease family protein [Candidatus Roizmanbacteria bacterium]
MFFVYFIQSIKNNKVYVGKTSKDPTIRLKEHNSGSNTWSRNNGPFTLIYYEKYHCDKDAISRELFYKTGFGKNIKKLIVDYMKNNNINVKLTGRSSDG